MAEYHAVRDAMIKASGELNLLRQVMEKRMNNPLTPTDPRDKRMDDLTMENHRLRGALDKIARRYPCDAVETMARVAKEALGDRTDAPAGPTVQRDRVSLATDAIYDLRVACMHREPPSPEEMAEAIIRAIDGPRAVSVDDEDVTDPYAVPLELMPEGHVFRGLTRTAHCWKQELARTWDWSVISGKGSTPRAAFVAAVEAAKVEG